VTTEGETRALGRRLIDDFGRGWERARVDLILEVFAEDATFLDDPFATPIVGAAAIREYWKDVPYHQSEITFTPGEIFAAGPWFSTEFRLVYRRRRTGEWVDARGAIFCELNGEKVGEMRMYWIRR
jgi:ketosteroid isomerase-like protein